MPETLRLAPDLLSSLRCPACRHPLERAAAGLTCVASACGRRYPVIDGVPVLIHDERSLFSIRDFVEARDTYFSNRNAPRRRPAWRRLANRLIPEISVNVRARENLATFERLLTLDATRPRVLVLGGSIVGSGMEGFLSSARLDVVETDIALGDRVDMICDAHDIPFADGTFDGLVAQAVLEHVVDPYRSVEEIHRVLKPNGLVYSETAFMQAVHGGRYDFTRFTWLGHRRLFRRFEEIESGATCGPGMAFGWAHQYFWRAFAERTWARALARLFARYTAFAYKYFDRHLIDRPRAWDAASAVFFLGRRSDSVLSDRELIRLYPGGRSSGGRREVQDPGPGGR